MQRDLVVRYQQAIHVALRDVADALAGYRKTAEQHVTHRKTVKCPGKEPRLWIDVSQ